jgi:KipI family sensor histidine kinase inhibitor
MDNLRISQYGPSALLVEFADRVHERSLARCRGLLRCLEENALEELREITPGFCSLLLEFEDAKAIAHRYGALRKLLQLAKAQPKEEAARHQISVCYDGPDLERLAQRNRLSVHDVVELHSLPIYSVLLIGFSPGFPYLGPLNARLHVERHATPRARVPAGSVAIGGEHTGIYSIASPGGWWLVGRTNAKLFSVSKAVDHGSKEAFLLRQGDLMSFRPVSILPDPR